MRFIRPDKMDARTEYRVRQTQRVTDSPSLADRFPELKSLSLELGHYDSDGVSRASQIKYTLNLKQARSVFRIDCANKDCVQGDFDLSQEISKAVTSRSEAVTGELRCHGWQSKTTIDQVFPFRFGGLIGHFQGFETDQFLELQNGETWQQDAVKKRYAYRYRPKATLWQEARQYYMDIEGMHELIQVHRVPVHPSAAANHAVSSGSP